MKMKWAEFKQPITDQRFILPIWDFTCDLKYVPIDIGADRLRAVTNLVGSAIIDAIRGVPGCPLSAIEVRPGKVEQEQAEDSTESAYVTIANTSPVYDFALQIGPKTCRMFKLRSSLEDFIATVPILHRACEQLFRQGTTPEDEPVGDQPSLLSVLGIQDRVHRFQFSFEHRLRLGAHIAEGDREALNVELIEKLVRIGSTDRRGQHPEREAPLLSLTSEALYRGDVSLSLEKSFGGEKVRNIWVIFEGPFNITQKDVNLRFDFRCGEGRGELSIEDLTDWYTPVVGFYRDMILRRFLPSLLYDIQVEPRLF